jgi:hypothetical protein
MSSRATTFLAALLASAACLFLARFELHTDDTGVEVFLLLAAGLVLGTIHPRHAWVWGLALGSSIVLANVWNLQFGHARPGPATAPGLALLELVTVMIATAGAYGGVFLRSLLGDSRGKTSA